MTIFFLIANSLVHFRFLPKKLIKHPHFQHLSPYQCITYHILTNHLIPHLFWYYLLLFKVFFFPFIFGIICQYVVILPKNYTIIELKTILWIWSLQIKVVKYFTTKKYFFIFKIFPPKLMVFWWLVHLVVYQLASSGPLPLFLFKFFSRVI
jgi:hypothetical protein